MAAAYESARRRHADKHAPGIIVVDHKMVTIMWHMLHARTPCQSRNRELLRIRLLGTAVLPLMYGRFYCLRQSTM